MAFDPDLSTPRDLARFRLGDTDDPPIIAEASYDAILGLGLAPNEALAQLAEAIGFELLKSEGAIALGDQKVDFKKQADEYFLRAKALRTEIPDPSLTAGQEAAVGRMEQSCYFPF